MNALPSLFVTEMSRIQFAVTVITHFLLVATSIGMMLVTVIFEMMYAFGGDKNEKYGRLALFFGRIFFFSFATGVLTGIVMELQFGLNWSSYSKFFGDIIGVPLVIESMLAFFVESNLIGLWRFTWGKMNKKWHAFIGLALLISSMFSIVWIISINAFMQNPYGYHMEGQHARLNSFIDLFENPQYPNEFGHVFIGILIVSGFVTAGISAWQILHKRDPEIFKRALQIGLLVAVPVAFSQQLLADNQIQATMAVQPMKFAAVEGQYDNAGSKTTGVPWYAFATINEQKKTIKGLAIPDLGSYFGSGQFTGKAVGMKTIAKAYHTKFDKTVAKSYKGHMSYYPPVTLMFIAMRWMVYAGFFFTIFGVLAMLMMMRKKKDIAEHRKTLITLGIAMCFPYITITAGWIVAEVGRFPFVVYGLFTQFDAVSPTVTAASVTMSLTIFTIMDALLLYTMVYISHRYMKKGVPDINGEYPELEPHLDPFDRRVFKDA
ncbi:cytochrome ubiquinol oxidase subunit I [Companilactobacillus versmoldensis]|uniref:cytochrome ubiquinol oxidase subunit I n=1 Tax=Companilactobacillus versmoldensis TaxID=194326 RepID=UPI0002492FCB|nr:cytochrome ubiquinol oxidase subunit I [Companilactobacillus versmoldensis]